MRRIPPNFNRVPGPDPTALSSSAMSRIAKGLACPTHEEAKKLERRIMNDPGRPADLEVEAKGCLVKARDPAMAGLARDYIYNVWLSSQAIKCWDIPSRGGGQA
jgi:hypothetical protein